MSIEDKTKILFVCLGNICRSPAAEGVMRRLLEQRGIADRFELDSAGFYGGHAGDLPDRRMRVHARQRGLELTHISRRIRRADFDYFDWIVGMDDANYSALRRMAATPDEERKLLKMASFLRLHPRFDCIPDPYYEGSEGFEVVLDLLDDACEGLLDFLLKKQREKD